MKKRTAFIGAILCLIPIGQPLLIKTGVVLSGSAVIFSLPEKANPVFINNGCPRGIKDNIAPRKAVRFFI